MGPQNPGAWTPYQIRLRNNGVDFEGEVLLVPEPERATSTPFAPRDFGPVLSLAEVPSPSIVPSLGATEVGARRTAGPAVSSSDFSVHRAHVSLAGGTEKTLTLLVVEARAGYRAEVRTKRGETAATSPPSAIRRGATPWRS